MIGVYAGLSVKPEHVEEFLKTIEPLVTASRKDEGNGVRLHRALGVPGTARKAHGHRAFHPGRRRMGAAARLRAGRAYRQLPISDVKTEGARHPL